MIKLPVTLGRDGCFRSSGILFYTFNISLSYSFLKRFVFQDTYFTVNPTFSEFVFRLQTAAED